MSIDRASWLQDRADDPLLTNGIPGIVGDQLLQFIFEGEQLLDLLVNLRDFSLHLLANIFTGQLSLVVNLKNMANLIEAKA